jgi:hypothetical protein
MAPRTAVILVCAALCGCAPRVDQDPRVALIRERLHITPPYTIVSHDGYLDGGSSAYVIRGANRRRLTVCWDGAGRAMESDALSQAAKHLDSLEYYMPVDTIPRLLYLGGLRSQGGGAVPVGSPRESTLIDLLTLAAEQHMGKAFVARVDSVHDAGRIEGLGPLLQPLDEEQRRYAAAAGLVWGLREQRVRGYWLAANDPARTWLDSAGVKRNAPVLR